MARLCLNLTKVELKLVMEKLYDSVYDRLNLTKVELKRLSSIDYIIIIMCLNLTKVELKRNCQNRR